ncbi:MAG: hypothetical protein PHN81_01805 [Actinomycetota bacterium]|nr:hypothetical protein [Actinomycetota bacterium]
MKKFFLISTTIIILSVTILTAGGCSTNAAVTYVAAEFIGSDFELALPEKWEGGTKKELDSVAEDLKEAGRAEIADKVVASKKDLLFFGYDTEDVISNDVISTLTICGEPSGSISLEEYIEISYKNMASSYEEAGYDFKIIEKDIVPLGNYNETGRFIIEQTVDGIKTKVVQYIVKHKNDFWVLTFTAEPGKFDENIEKFDETFESFKIID